MPFIEFDSTIDGVLVGIWEVCEDEMFFLTKLKMYEHEWSRLERITHPKKRLEWLSSRLVMKEILKIGYTDRVQSMNSETGKPYLSNRSYNISYTHSGIYSAAIASPDFEVGIDMEYLKRKRNMETRRLFMNPFEISIFEAKPDFNYFILLWSAKETLYKVFGQKGVSFREHISFDLEDFRLSSRGVLKGRVNTGKECKDYNIYYAFEGDFLLTYTIDCLEPVLVS